jgi:branched-chain amino acid transport system permease protein
LSAAALRHGLICGGIAIYGAATGILAAFDGRVIIVGLLTLGDIVLVVLGLAAGFWRKPAGSLAQRAAAGALAGFIAGLLPALLLMVMSAINLRGIFISLSPELAQMLRLGLPSAWACLVFVAGAASLGLLGALAGAAPLSLRRSLIAAAGAVLFFGAFQELLQIMMQNVPGMATLQALLYSWEGLTPAGAGVIFILAVGLGEAWRRLRPAAGQKPSKGLRPGRARFLFLASLLVLLPLAGGSYIGQVLMLVGLYTLMGMGLNLEVGLAGLLDLGFVAFFAVGAYATALLTADSPHSIAAYTGLPSLTYWEAMPLAVLVSVGVGIIFGIPVLGVRGDYLAVATLGLGEIVRVIVLSDAAAPLLAGAQGILQIPKPRIGSFELSNPVELYYLTLLCAGLAAYCAWRLENSRLGRAWMALRDDEDVAQALGINLVGVKLLAYGLGAAFAGLAGSIFAVMLSSVFPSSFQLLVSINVLTLIIVGGIGSLPGVLLGAVVLIGLPELLREFGENRYLFYGVALVIMMRYRPQGLMPALGRRSASILLKASVSEPQPGPVLPEPLRQASRHAR